MLLLMRILLRSILIQICTIGLSFMDAGNVINQTPSFMPLIPILQAPLPKHILVSPPVAQLALDEHIATPVHTDLALSPTTVANLVPIAPNPTTNTHPMLTRPKAAIRKSRVFHASLEPSLVKTILSMPH